MTSRQVEPSVGAATLGAVEEQAKRPVDASSTRPMGVHPNLSRPPRAEGFTSFPSSYLQMGALAMI